MGISVGAVCVNQYVGLCVVSVSLPCLNNCYVVMSQDVLKVTSFGSLISECFCRDQMAALINRIDMGKIKRIRITEYSNKETKRARMTRHRCFIV